MINEEKIKEIADFLYFKLSHIDYNTLKRELLAIAQWKDEQVKQLLIEKTKLLSPSAAQDSVRRCIIEEIYRELFNEEMQNSNPYIK